MKIKYNNTHHHLDKMLGLAEAHDDYEVPARGKWFFAQKIVLYIVSWNLVIMAWMGGWFYITRRIAVSGPAACADWMADCSCIFGMDHYLGQWHIMEKVWEADLSCNQLLSICRPVSGFNEYAINERQAVWLQMGQFLIESGISLWTCHCSTIW